MSTTKTFNDFTNQYQLSKTLRFELIPQDGTEKLVRQLFEKPEENHHEIIKKDLKLSKSYKNVKQLIDCKHRNIIDDVLYEFQFTPDQLEILNKTSKETHEENIDEKDPLAKLRKIVADALDAKSKIMFDAKLLITSPSKRALKGICKLFATTMG